MSDLATRIPVRRVGSQHSIPLLLALAAIVPPLTGCNCDRCQRSDVGALAFVGVAILAIAGGGCGFGEVTTCSGPGPSPVTATNYDLIRERCPGR